MCQDIIIAGPTCTQAAQCTYWPRRAHDPTSASSFSSANVCSLVLDRDRKAAAWPVALPAARGYHWQLLWDPAQSLGILEEMG